MFTEMWTMEFFKFLLHPLVPILVRKMASNIVSDQVTMEKLPCIAISNCFLPLGEGKIPVGEKYCHTAITTNWHQNWVQRFTIIITGEQLFIKFHEKNLLEGLKNYMFFPTVTQCLGGKKVFFKKKRWKNTNCINQILHL